MTVFGITMVRDEADIIDITMRHALAHVDHVLCLDNGSTDGTREILEEIAAGSQLTIQDDPEVGYYQSRKMTGLADAAASSGADWVLPFDADEIWTAGPGRIGDILDNLTGNDQVDVVEADFYHHAVTGLDPVEGTVVERMGWRNTTSVIPKVACRTRAGLVIAQGNHWATYDGTLGRPWDRRFVLHHYPYRSLEQFTRKMRNGAEAYAAAPDIKDDFGWHWQQYGALDDEAIAAQFAAYCQDEPGDDMIFDPPEVWR